MTPEPGSGGLRGARLLLLGLVAVLVVLGLALTIVAVVKAGVRAEPVPADALATSRDECVVCHRSATPGIVEQYGRSTMAAAEVSCRSCHEVARSYAGAVEHEGAYVLSQPTPATCQGCHEQEVAQFYQSRHSLPAYVAYAGSKDLSPEMLVLYEAIPEGSYAPDKMRNALFAIEGPDVTKFACETCHNVGKPQPDLSVGECQKCHLRHQFSLEQARKPETCNACHIGPDHPQWEIYQESPHGIAYATGGHTWNWEAEPGTLSPRDFTAPTCATCHFAGFGASATSHDVGDRLTWYLFAPISTRRPGWQDNLDRMQSVCFECHNSNFIETFYQDADKLTEAVNKWVKESDGIQAELKADGLLTDEPFDETFDFTYFELWHHWGRTSKFGAWMQGPDYTQWHGAYELVSDLVELRELGEQKRGTGGGE